MPKQSRRQASRAGGASTSSPDARTIDAAPVSRRSLRWSGFVTSTAPLIVTRGCLLSVILASPGFVTSSTGNNYTPVYESVKIRRVRMVIPQIAPTTATNAQEISLEWSSYLGRNTRVSKVVTSSLGCSFASVPPKDSRASFWSSANTSANATTSINEVLFTVSHDPMFAVVSTSVPFIIELDLECVLANDTNSVVAFTYGATGAGQSAGLFMAPLDLVSSTGGLGSARFDPLMIQDVRLLSNNAALTIVTLTRTN